MMREARTQEQAANQEEGCQAGDIYTHKEINLFISFIKIFFFLKKSYLFGRFGKKVSKYFQIGNAYNSTIQNRLFCCVLLVAFFSFDFLFGFFLVEVFLFG